MRSCAIPRRGGDAPHVVMKARLRRDVLKARLMRDALKAHLMRDWARLTSGAVPVEQMLSVKRDLSGSGLDA